MKKILLAALASLFLMHTYSQDSTDSEKADTIRIGGITIIKAKGKKDSTTKQINITNTHKKRNSNVSTNWWIVDLGFANFSDNTDYTSSATQAFAPGATEDWFKLRTGKSVNVNIWVFMQKMNIISHVLNLKYGMGVELNNYRFDDEKTLFSKNPTKVFQASALDEPISKNKLAVDYVTLPLLLNFDFTPNRKHGFGISAGVSGGYLYSARQKLKRGDDKEKLHDDYDLRKWKLAYIGELNLGIIKLYGSYAVKNMWEKGLDHTPYNMGVRFSRF